jgi:serine protease AprX
MRLSKRILPLFLTGLLAATGATAGANASNRAAKDAVQTTQMVDGDRNKIFDTLDRVLKQMDDKQRVPVLVMANRPTDLAELEKAAGPIPVKYQYQVVPAIAASLTRSQVDILARQSYIRQIEYDDQVRMALDGATRWFGATKARQDFGVDGNHDGAPGYSKNDIVMSFVELQHGV